MVSVIIPAWHSERFIRESLESILAQTCQDFEVIVVEDGSHDGTESTVQSVAQQTSRPIRFCRHEQNRGLPAARNTGIALARGEYIALLDSDDCWSPEHLSSILEAFRGTGAELVYGHAVLFSEVNGQRVFLPMGPTVASATPEALYTRNYIVPSSAVFTRAASEAVGPFDETLRSCEDLDFWLRFAKRGMKIVSTNKETCYYRKHAAAMTGNSLVLAEFLARVLKKHLDWKSTARGMFVQRTTEAFSAAGRMHFRQQPRKASALYFESWRLQPIRLDRFLLFLIAWMRARLGPDRQRSLSHA